MKISIRTFSNWFQYLFLFSIYEMLSAEGTNFYNHLNKIGYVSQEKHVKNLALVKEASE